MRRRTVIAGGIAAPFAATAARAQAPAYPTGPVRIVVPFAAGSATDIGARTIAEHLNRVWGQPVIVDNKPGGNSNIAAEFVAKSKPDGYTIFVASNTAAATNVALFKKLNYDPLKDFEPITTIGFAPTILLSHPSLPAKNLQELLAYARANPGKLNFGSGSASTRMSGEMLKALGKIDIVHVGYKATPLALADAVAGHIQLVFADPQTATPHIRSGALRAYGVSTRGTYKLLPDLPTLIEQGLDDFELEAWTCVLVPAGTPQAIKDKIYKDAVAAISAPANVARTAAGGSEIRPSTPEQLREVQVREIRIYRNLMQLAGIEPE
jgi:tripartite-type tricarboxylate transporter receptor subunit TctC